jgi:hypothetical protein
MPSNNSVEIEQFAESHFVKIFAKKHKQHWDRTLRSMIDGLERIELLLQTEKAETICDADDIKIIKTQFRMDGTKESAKTSGNRCIVAWHVKKLQVSVLLVYSKTDISSHNETATWQKLIKENYPKYKHFFQ